MIDAHNHLQDQLLARPEVFEALEGIGLRAAVVNGTKQDDWPDVERLAGRYPWVIPSYGLHPWYLTERRAGWEDELARRLDAGGAAVGEVGLDRWMDGYDLEDQCAVLRAHLALAAERNLPVTIHCLKAWGALQEVLTEGPLPTCGFLLHAYGGPAEMVRKFVKLGAYLSFSGSFLTPGKERKLAPFREIPEDRLLVETDAPAMPLPEGTREYDLPEADGKAVNHPANIRAVYRGLSAVRQLEPGRLSSVVEANFRRLFAPVLPPGMQ